MSKGLTEDPNDPRIQRGPPDDKPVPQHDVYLVLSEEERGKGFVRPYRDSYVHVGEGGAEIDPADMSKSGLKGMGCGTLTKMGRELSETYARQPKFYGATYCVGCRMHRPVAEFVWDGTDERVGS